MKMNDLEEIVSNDERYSIIKATDIYFKPRSFEKSGRIYERLGIKPFRKLVIGTAGRVVKSVGFDKSAGTYFIGKGSEKDIGAYETLARLNEVIHAPFTVFAVGIIAQKIAEENLSGIILAGTGFLFNGYCTMLQRYNRARAYKVLERRGER